MNKKELTKRIYTDNTKELNKLIEIEFNFHQPKEIKNHINLLSYLEESTLEYGIVRLKAIKEEVDMSKYIAPIVTIIFAVITIYQDFLNVTFKEKYLIPNTIMTLIAIVAASCGITYLIGKNKFNKSSFGYFKNLLELALEKKRKNTKTTP